MDPQKLGEMEDSREDLISLGRRNRIDFAGGVGVGGDRRGRDQVESQDGGRYYCRNGWNYITNEVLFAWAIMYWSLPDKFLQISTPTKKAETKKSTANQKENTKNNVVSLQKAKQEIEKKKEVAQLSLFGGVAQ